MYSIDAVLLPLLESSSVSILENKKNNMLYLKRTNEGKTSLRILE